MFQLHTGHLRVYEQRSVGYWMAAKTVGVCEFRKVTPAIASMDTPWTYPAWHASVRKQWHTSQTGKKTTVFLCDVFLPLSTDVDECSELNNRMLLCKNAKCINTVGSYQCVCLRGFTASDKPNYCVEAATRQTSPHTQWAGTRTRGRQEAPHAQTWITILMRKWTVYIQSLTTPQTPSGRQWSRGKFEAWCVPLNY